ncbi:MAG: lysophospholipid acyltransferase family protein [Kofleriaceae bacterium]|nr:lysophospholipid acyltransferase family protein [Kofleriaceae bacterium]
MSSKQITYFIGDTWLKAFGWKVEGGVPDVRKAVVIAAPHTSNWDLPFTLAVTWKLGFPMSWLGKHTLFTGAKGKFFRAVGGIPVNRGRRSDAVANAVDVIDDHEDLFLIVAPEGTRSKSVRWKTGFYHMAVGAKVPIVLGFLDYKKRRGGLGTLFWPTGDIDADMKQIRAFYANIEGKHPERMSATTLGDSASDAGPGGGVNGPVVSAIPSATPGISFSQTPVEV